MKRKAPKDSPTEVAAAGCSKGLAHRLLARGMTRAEIIARIAEDKRRKAALAGVPKKVCQKPDEPFLRMALLAEEARLYADLGAAEVGGGDVTQLRSKLDAVRARRETAVRKRAAAEGLTKLEAELLDARRAADGARSALAGACNQRASQREFAAGVEMMARAYGRGAGASARDAHTGELSRAYKAVADLATGQPALQFTAAAASAPAALPPSLQSLTDLISRLDIAAGLAGAIRQAREADARHYRLALERRAPANMPAVYRSAIRHKH